jgi:small-conductance mechanosensitive channel
MTGEPDVFGVHLIDPSGVTLRVVCDTEPASQFPVEREYRRRVLRAFEAQAIPLAMLSTIDPRPSGAITAGETTDPADPGKGG